MRFEEEQNGVPGCVPEFGAIFMSNSATKKECIKRKLLGLPSGQANFVKQVKAGMILFLFEFEKRELHGVFQAFSDGAMNIVPHAFISSGKQFPAQVKFTPLWYCTPLCEDEFYDAIKENYFSKNKFNFGLSEDQVYKLLSLFSFRKLEVQPHQPRFTICKVPSYSTSKLRRAADDGRSIMNNQLQDEHNANCHCGSVISNEDFVASPVSGGRTTDGGRAVISAGEGNEYKVDNRFGKVISRDYFEESLHHVGRVTNNGRFATTDCVGNERNMDIDHRAVISTKYPEYSFDNEVRRIPNDVRFANVDSLGVDNNIENGYGAAISTLYPGSFQPTNTAAYSHSSNIQQSDSFVHNQLRSSSPLRCSMGPQVSHRSCSTPSGDANVTSTCPYDPDSPGINDRPLSSSMINRSFNPVPDSDPSSNSNAVHIFPSVGNQTLRSFVEPVATRRCSDVNSGFDYSVPMPLSKKHHEYSGSTSRPFFGAAYSETVGKEFSKNEGSRGISFLEPSYTPGLFSERQNSDGMNEGPSSCTYSASIFRSFVFDYGNSQTSQGKHDHDAFAGNMPTLKQGCSQSQGHVYPVEFESIDHHDSYSLNPDVHRSSRTIYSDCQKKRASVFSRLGLASKTHMEGNDTPDDNNEDAMDTSADEVMSRLHQRQYQWVKLRNHTQLTKDNAKDFRKKRQTTSHSELLTVQKISKEMTVNSTAETEDNGEQFAAMTSFVDFKRRSEVRKIHDDDTKISGCNENAEKNESGGLHKRRKLIRPNFNKNELPDVKSINTSKMFEPHLLCQISREDKCIEAERVSTCRGEEMETCGANFRNDDENGKELSQKFGIRIMQLSVSPEATSHIAEEALIIKNSVVDGVSQDLKNSDQSTGLESSLETHQKNTKEITASEIVDGSYQDLNNSNQSIGQDLSLETGKVNAIVSLFSETERCRGNEKELCNFDKVYPLDGEMQTNLASGSSNQNPKSEKAAEDLLGNGSKGCEIDFKQNVENENEVISSSGETTIAGCKAISSNLYSRSSQVLADTAVNDEGEGNKHPPEHTTALLEAPKM
ncbi:hypothetical protein JRO89_XS06G0222900 [Xanthoceras sorbifolium]|uniref:DCD domain-containing protein n=1 Tax=Xanthoceras sorbifolium TaxID=99658 RepID=A0ABQ8HZL4_9ROSI|nr:hypothetical protein JRO89_XS06G0222900 [Xanthoceras sorbifolium]